MVMVHSQKVYIGESDFTPSLEPPQSLVIESAFRENRYMHSLAEERCLFDEINDCEATNTFLFRFTSKKEPIIVTVSINIIL